MNNQQAVVVMIPALDEEETIGQVIDAIPNWVSLVVVCNNGSTDNTARIAAEHGAQVVEAPERGYGSACLAGMDAIESAFPSVKASIIVFLDADLSDDPSEMGKLVDPILSGNCDFVVGSRTLGESEPGSLTLLQRFGNALSCRLIKWIFSTEYSDLGPFRAIRWASLKKLQMDDPAYGWTVQMQIRAVRLDLRIKEIPVTYRNRKGGQSKVSGTMKGVFGAGVTILRVILLEAIQSTLSHHAKS